MKILVLGGTKFVGRAIVEALLDNEHQVTLFNRGSDQSVFPNVPRLLGDRNVPDDLAKIKGHNWDAVVDVSAYRPEQVRRVLSLLGDSAPHYVFVSTVSVYAPPPPGANEDAALLQVDESFEPKDPDSYGGLKVLCERELQALGIPVTILRPTIVIGPHDDTNRFSRWVQQISQGSLHAPERLEQPIQLIDAQDLARFATHCINEQIVGIFNTVGPRQPITLAEMVNLISDALEVSVNIEEAQDAADFPLTLPVDGSYDGFFSIDGSRAYASGLTLTSIGDSARSIRAALDAT